MPGIILCKVAGLPMYVATSPDQIPELSARVGSMLDEVLASIHTEDIGVHVQVSPLSMTSMTSHRRRGVHARLP